MATIQTVTGPIDTAGLGQVLMHEHVFVLSPEIHEQLPEGGTKRREVDDAIARLRELKADGIDTIVDLTVIGLGRYIPRIQRINAAGRHQHRRRDRALHVQRRAALLPLPRPGHDPRGARVDGRHVRRVTSRGHRRTPASRRRSSSARPTSRASPRESSGCCAPSPRPIGRRACRSRRTPMRATKRGLEQQKSSSARASTSAASSSATAATPPTWTTSRSSWPSGSYIGMDRFGIDLLLPFEDRVNTVATLCERGHADQMVLSHDASCFIDWLPT